MLVCDASTARQISDIASSAARPEMLSRKLQSSIALGTHKPTLHDYVTLEYAVFDYQPVSGSRECKGRPYVYLHYTVFSIADASLESLDAMSRPSLHYSSRPVSLSYYKSWRKLRRSRASTRSPNSRGRYDRWREGNLFYVLYLDNRLQYDVSLTFGRSMDGDFQQEQTGSDPESSYIMLVVTPSCKLLLTSQAIYIYVQSIIPY